MVKKIEFNHNATVFNNEYIYTFMQPFCYEQDVTQGQFV